MKTEVEKELDNIKNIETVKSRVAGRRHQLFFYFGFILLVSFLILTYFVKKDGNFIFDLQITNAIQLISTPGFDQLMTFVSFMGNYYQSIALLVIVTAFFLVIDKKKEALFLFVSTAGVSLMSLILKAFVARPRPSPDLIHQVGEYLRNDSFPSGHVLFAMGFFGILLYFSFIFLKKKILRYTLVSLLSLCIIFMGISRIYLGAHWFSDTLGSYLIGMVWLMLVTFFYRRNRNIQLPN